MDVIFILLPLALLFVGIALAWFIWAVRSGQFEDLETPAVRILFDDELSQTPAVSDTPGDGESTARASAREVEVR